MAIATGRLLARCPGHFDNGAYFERRSDHYDHATDDDDRGSHDDEYFRLHEHVDNRPGHSLHSQHST